MKKVIYLVLMLMVVLTLSACRDTEENKVDIKTVASFDEVILTEENNVISVTFIEDGNAESAYQTFKNEMEGIDTTKVIALSTTIGGMLYEMGIIPLGVTSSSNLHKDLIARRCDVVSINEDGSVNYGSSCMVPNESRVAIVGGGFSNNANNEHIIALNPSVVVCSDAMPEWATDYQVLKAAGIKVIRVPQSMYYDPFIMLRVFEEINPDLHKQIQEILKEMKNDIDYATNLKETSSIKNAQVALLQSISGDGSVSSTTSNGFGSPMNIVITKLGLTNIYEESSTLNVEDLLMKNPDYIIAYAMANDGGVTLANLMNELNDTEGIYRTLTSQIVPIDFESSVTFNLTRVLVEIADEIYGS